MNCTTASTPAATGHALLWCGKSSDADYQGVLLDEANHRIKNSLQMLQALLDSACRDTGNPEARAVLADASRRIAAMGMAQQVLYGAGNAADFSAQTLLQAVCDNASISFGRGVIISCEAIASCLAKPAATPLALILYELLTNAAKHGADARGEVRIKVTLTKHSGSYELSVQDNGPGFDFEDVGKRSSGLGLVTSLSRQIDGTFAVERNAGALCTVTFRDQGPCDRALAIRNSGGEYQP